MRNLFVAYVSKSPRLIVMCRKPWVLGTFQSWWRSGLILCGSASVTCGPINVFTVAQIPNTAYISIQLSARLHKRGTCHQARYYTVTTRNLRGPSPGSWFPALRPCSIPLWPASQALATTQLTTAGGLTVVNKTDYDYGYMFPVGLLTLPSHSKGQYSISLTQTAHTRTPWCS